MPILHRTLVSCMIKIRRASAGKRVLGVISTDQELWAKQLGASGHGELLLQGSPAVTRGKWVAEGIKEENKVSFDPLLQQWLKFSHLCEIKTQGWVEQYLHQGDRG